MGKTLKVNNSFNRLVNDQIKQLAKALAKMILQNEKSLTPQKTSATKKKVTVKKATLKKKAAPKKVAPKKQAAPPVKEVVAAQPPAG